MPNDERHNGRVSTAYLQPLLELLRERHIDPAQLCQLAGLTQHELAGDSIAASSYLRLLEAGAARCDDAAFGLHVGERVKLGTYHVYGMLLMSCSDLGQALQQTLRYEGLAHDLGRSLLGRTGELSEYRWDSWYPDASRHLAESVMAGIRVFGDWFAGTSLPPTPVYFAHPAPADLREHQRLFGSSVEFDAPWHAARFPSALLTWPVPNAAISLHPILQQHADQLLLKKHAQQHEHEQVSAVRNAIRRHLASDCARLPMIALELGLSVRSLQRKLSESGLNFQQILDQTRCELAQTYLRQPSLSLADIAFLLAYQDQSAFQHAFKEWTGLTPKAYRDHPLN